MDKLIILGNLMQSIWIGKSGDVTLGTCALDSVVTCDYYLLCYIVILFILAT